jgi:hypothetical protein
MNDVILAECPSCSSWTVNPPPEQESCEECRRTTWPVHSLVRHSFPAGCRIDVTGSVFGPDGSLLFERTRTESPDGDVARLRKLVALYDEGALTESGVGYESFRHEIESVLGVLKTGETVLAFTSWCGAPAPPPETVRAEIEIDAQGITIRPLP